MNPPHHPAWPARRMLFLGIAACALAAAWWLQLSPAGILPGRGGWQLVKEFFSAALHPALTYQDPAGLPAGSPAFLTQIGLAAVDTLRMALAAVSLSVAGGLILGFLGSSVWWPERRRGLPRLLWLAARAVMTLLRSVHELIWATLILAATGITPLTAAIAIALPYSGTLAKIFAEMAEEASPDTKGALQTLGASPLQMFFCGIVPRVRAELASYLLYRFECGLRSAAVLGFLGIPTLGLRISQSFENLHFREVWTALYVLLALVIVFDSASGRVRRRLVSGTSGRRDVPLQAAIAGFVLLVTWAWTTGGFFIESMDPTRRAANVARFFREITPWPVRQGDGSVSAVWNWAWNLLTEGRGAMAAANTLAMSVVAIVGAAALAAVLIPFAARTLASAQPYLPDPRRVSFLSRAGWMAVVAAARAFFVLTRSIPEYIWAFLFVAMVADQFWAAILALALHNAGILGRLGAETLENADSAAPGALRGLGATRGQLLVAGLLPLSLPRFLVYFFYRWETCLREGTVLGMLGVATLGRLIKDARAFDRCDEMIFFILLGALLVLLGDIVSGLIRRTVRV